MFTRAIVRQPAKSLVHGLTSANLGHPDYALALAQHQHYVDMLGACDLEVTVLPPADEFPDSCFIEDPVLLTGHGAILTRPGALSRLGEVALNREAIAAFYGDNIKEITAPGTLDAGDVLRVDNHFYIGLSKRTNQEGARQLTHILTHYEYTASVLALKEVLHLKTGVSYLDKGNLLVSGEFINHPALNLLHQHVIDEEERYAANCILVNDIVLMPAGFPKTRHLISSLGYDIIEIDVSEFRKLDGGLSCLSLRF